MVVAVQSNLKQLKKWLSDKGYTVIDFENIHTRADAIIYYQKDVSDNCLVNMMFKSSSFENPVLDNSNTSGILLINAYNHHFDQIHFMLSNRLYSPIF